MKYEYRYRTFAALVGLLMLTLVPYGCGDRAGTSRDQYTAAGSPNQSQPSGQSDQDRSNPNPAPPQPGTPLEREPRPADADAGGAGARGPLGNPGGIREGQIRTLHLGPGVVTNAKFAVTTVSVNVGAGSATGSSSADPTLVGGTILGVYWAGNQDQFVDNVVLNGDGSVTVTLGANATAINNVRILILRQFGA